MHGIWARETTTTTGTGDLTVSSVTGYPRLSDVVGLNQWFRYAILSNSDGTPIEIGAGKMSDANTLVRALVFAKMVSGTFSRPESASGQVTLAAGTKRVIATADETSVAFSPVIDPSRKHSTQNNRIHVPYNLQQVATGSAMYPSFGNEVNAFQVLITERGPFDALVFQPTGTGDTCDVGLYTVGSDGLPARLVASKVNTAWTTSAINFFTVTQFTLTPGWYWWAFNTTGAGTLQRSTEIKFGYVGRASFTANPTPMIAKTHTQGTLPDPFGTPSVYGQSLSGASVPYVGLRMV